MGDYMNDDEVKQEKDFTRPTFVRNPGEIGIFIDVFDAVPNDIEAFGSRQYFLMTLKEKFYKEICQGEMYKVKGFFTKRNLLTDVTLEYFHPGVLLIIHTNTPDAAKDILKHFNDGKLTAAFQECFITEKLENRIQVTKMKLKLRLFPDEFELVESEWRNKELPVKYKLIESEKDMKMVQLIKRYQQKSFSRKMVKLKDNESTFEIHCPEFLVYLKQFCNVPAPEIRCISDIHKVYQDFSTNEDAHLGLYLFKDYLALISELQKAIRDIETHVTFPLSQIKRGTETPEQIKVNESIRRKINEVKNALREKAPLRLYSSQMDSFIPNTDRKVWGGLIYLIPASVSLLNDIDQQIDDYFQLGNFNEIIHDYQQAKQNT